MTAPSDAIPSNTASVTGISLPFTLLLAGACGLLAAANYFAQPLVGEIGAEIGLTPAISSFIVTLTQLGYCAGLLLINPLGDLLENRRLALVAMAASAGAFTLSAWAPNGMMFLVAALLTGVASTVIQILITIAADMARPEARGRVVGNIMSGLLLGILLARPLASLVADHFGWRVLYAGSAVATVGLILCMARSLPTRRPAATQSYVALIASLWTLLRTTPVLQRAASAHAAMFAAFSLFWTVMPLELAARYGMSQSGIALFALAGAGGALAAPIAGRIADRGWGRPARAGAMVLVAFSFASLWWGGPLWLLGVASVTLDAGVQINHIISQRSVMMLDAAVRARLNSLYMAIFFAGGAVGSAVASPLLTVGWHAVVAAGVAFPLAALAIWASERGNWSAKM